MSNLNIHIEKRETHLDTEEVKSDASTITLLTALVILLTVILVLVGSLFFLRRVRQQRKSRNSLPTYESSNRARGLSITAIPYSEKEHLLSESSTPSSAGSIPEIRITFPDEDDRTGRRASGTVVLVQMGDTIAFRPVDDSGLPPSYTAAAGGNTRFASVDLERVGGLREKI